MLNKSLFVQPRSGFVPFSNIGTAELDSASHHAPPAQWTQPSTEPSATHTPDRFIWQAPTRAGVHRLEMLILASICAYFSFGLGSLLG